MLAFTYQGAGQPAKLIDLERPDPGPGEVLLRIGATTVCGTDLRILRGDKTNLDMGVVLGHEVAGWIDTLGEGVSGYRVGDLATVVPSLSCGTCQPCVRGYEHLCDDAPLVGYQVNGGLAEYMLVPEGAVSSRHLISTSNSELSPEQVALTEPISCCVGGQRNYQVHVSDTVVILGAGPIGLIHLQLALIAGARHVVVSDPSAPRRAAAEHFGATHTVDPATGNLEETVQGLTDGHGADVAVLCIGIPALLNQALRLVRKRGRVSVFAGFAKEGWSEIAANLIHYREITITGASNSGREQFAEALQLIVDGRINTTDMVTHRFPLSQATEAIDFVATGEGIKVAVIPDRNHNHHQKEQHNA